MAIEGMRMTGEDKPVPVEQNGPADTPPKAAVIEFPADRIGIEDRMRQLEARIAALEAQLSGRL